MAAVIKLAEIREQTEIAKWRAAGYQAVDEMVKKIKDEIAGKSLEELSEIVSKEGKTITGSILSEVVKSRGQVQAGAQECVCEECGRTLKRQKQTHSKTLETRHGEMKISRPYFYCRYCNKGYYPFDKELEIAPDRKQYDLQRAAAELFTEVPYERASKIFERLTGIKMSNNSMHELAENIGEVADKVRVLPSRNKVEEVIERAGNGKVWRPVLVVAADGAALPTRPPSPTRSSKRGAGEWKEAKGFRIYLVGQERIEQIMSWHQIASEEEFGEAIRFAATLIPIEKVRIALIADGAKWIWTHLTAAFPDGKEILDYYHCSEHVHKLAELHFKDVNEQTLWIESTMARLNFGDVESVIWGLQRMQFSSQADEDEIRKLIGYLKNNEHRINYKAFKRGQYPRGSGGIESANKFICHVRMKRSGAWWYQINGNKMLRLRCAFYNDTFDELFARYKRLRSAKKS
jgi:hypothetical protein